MKEWILGTQDLTKTINDSIECYICRLFKDNIIDEETYVKMMSYRIVISEKNIWGKIVDDLLRRNNPDETLLINVVKLNIEEPAKGR